VTKKAVKWVNQVLSAKTFEGTKEGFRESSLELEKRAEELLFFLFSSPDVPTRKDLMILTVAWTCLIARL
jgi:hypothetical protein